MSLLHKRFFNPAWIATYLLLACANVLAAPVLLSDTDKHETVTLSADQLGAEFNYWAHRSVRSTIAIQPGSGFFYYEGHRETTAQNFGFGVGTASAPIDTYAGSSAQSIGLNATLLSIGTIISIFFNTLLIPMT